MKINGEAIYETVPWKYQNDTVNPDVWYTSSNKSGSVYAIVVKEPGDNVKLGAMANATFDDVKLIGYDGLLNWIKTNDTVVIYTNIRVNSNVKWAWTFEFKNVYLKYKQE